MSSLTDYLRSKQSIVAYIFFSNYFYGICGISLAIEASLQQDLPLNSFFFYIFLFCLTVLYYTKAYITEKKSIVSNPRSEWYFQKRKYVFASQVILTVVATMYAVLLLFTHFYFIIHLPIINCFLLIISPLVAGLYYGLNLPRFADYKLRNIGWLKPFVIGFVWAGLVTVYPLQFYGIEKEIISLPALPGLFLFVKNFMFVTVLCVMFDIKDYAADHNRQLKTFVVKAGLRNTIFYILIPLSILGLASYLMYGAARQFSYLRMGLNIIPFILLIAVAYSLHRRKSIFYYLIVIDGLMLVKAVFGSFSVLF